ncbi:unnamed protein product [Nezara viridula]|uniref:Uncharacterized protein n=1 Tax=Nezara viridula TaxID=85310 RepID=A0A9P0ECI9_NEZVI|nr:unnamed protein product [Nezara viridula]
MSQVGGSTSNLLPSRCLAVHNRWWGGIDLDRLLSCAQQLIFENGADEVNEKRRPGGFWWFLLEETAWSLGTRKILDNALLNATDVDSLKSSLIYTVLSDGNGKVEKVTQSGITSWRGSGCVPPHFLRLPPGSPFLLLTPQSLDDLRCKTLSSHFAILGEQHQSDEIIICWF